MTETIQLLLDATSIMIPVVTGFILFFGASIGKLWELKQSNSSLRVSWPLVACVFIASIASLTFFVGVAFLAIKASLGEAKSFYWLELDSKELIGMARFYLAAGYTVFLVAVAMAGIQYVRIAKYAT